MEGHRYGPLLPTRHDDDDDDIHGLRPTYLSFDAVN